MKIQLDIEYTNNDNNRINLIIIIIILPTLYLLMLRTLESSHRTSLVCQEYNAIDTYVEQTEKVDWIITLLVD